MFFNFIESEQRLLYFDGSDELPQDKEKDFYGQVKYLDFTSNLFTSFDYLLEFPNVKEVIMDNNYLTDNMELSKHIFESVEVLSLNNNKFENLDITIDQLQWIFPNIRYLSLLGCPICPYYALNLDYNDDYYQEYRLNIISKMPKLNFLDAKRVDNFERPVVTELPLIDDIPIIETLVQPTRIINKSTPKMHSLKRLFGFNTSSTSSTKLVTSCDNRKSEYTPLPETQEHGKHEGYYGKSKYRYVGENSEGNRFIANNDL
ncbi:unnamed protein product [Diamesa tonsa]